MQARDSSPYGPSGGFDVGNIIGDPFALATVSIAIRGRGAQDGVPLSAAGVSKRGSSAYRHHDHPDLTDRDGQQIAWLIAFVAQILGALEVDKFPKFTWWTAAFELAVILGVAIIIALGRVPKYHVAMVGFLSAGLVFTCSAINDFVYWKKATMEAAGAGHILLSIVHIVWIFYFGTTPDAAPYVDTYMMDKDGNRGRMSMPYGHDRPHTSTSSHHAPQMYTSAQLSGFENTSPNPQQDQRMSSQQLGGPSASHAGQAQQQSVLGPDSEVPTPTEYPYQAKAIYQYEASPNDPNELSFQKHEILEVSDVSGRWWQARKTNGETGIAPSNYLILL
ncbi:high osmolarity signaling protein SHO1B [Ascodesmis nigricans]|uniref:High osmolarity signaling protein SHO1B n=1 Tax=Ascodesmis nigricans TaxID=341454 RepID=A0A4S2MHM9_9PEZI|nr:high osmolarity signaling protein SHO1B [Ascodesmis nigricans]